MDSPRKDYKYNADSNFNFEGKNWIYQGLGFGILMYIFMVVIYPIIFGEANFYSEKLVESFFAHMVMGLMYGVSMKYGLRFLRK